MVKKQVPLNLVPISGMQGTGKDTLINDFLTAPEGVTGTLPFKPIHYKKCEITAFDDLMERQIRRIAKHVIDWGRATKLAFDNPDTMVIMDRCYHDATVYIDTFEFLGWYSERDRDYLHDLLIQAFEPWDTDGIQPFFLNPPLGFIKENLKARAERGEAKWREDNEEYLNVLYKAYNYYLSVDDPYGVVGYPHSNEATPGYECIQTNRTSRILLLRNHLLKQWRKHTNAIS